MKNRWYPTWFKHGFSSIPPEFLKNNLCSLTACTPCRLHVCPGLFLDTVVSFSFLSSFQCKLTSCGFTCCQNQDASPSEMSRLTFCWIPQTESASSILSNVKCHLVNQIWRLHLLSSIFPDWLCVSSPRHLLPRWVSDKMGDRIFLLHVGRTNFPLWWGDVKVIGHFHPFCVNEMHGWSNQWAAHGIGCFQSASASVFL